MDPYGSANFLFFKNFQGRHGVQLERHPSKIKIKKTLQSSNSMSISFFPPWWWRNGGSNAE